jgi:hypothetical protein
MEGYELIIHELHSMQLQLLDCIREANKSKGRGMDDFHSDRLIKLRTELDKTLGWFVNEEKNSI